MATVGCHVEWGQVIQGDVVYLCIVLQQKSDTVKVVSLSRHVNWGQAVLGEEGNTSNHKGFWGQNTAIQGNDSNLTPCFFPTLCFMWLLRRLVHSGFMFTLVSD